MKYDPNATMSTAQPPTLMRLAPRSKDFDYLMLTEKTSLSYDDPRLQSFKRIDGHRSALIYCVDKTCGEVVFVVTVSLFKEMSRLQRERYEWMFNCIHKERPYRHNIYQMQHKSVVG